MCRWICAFAVFFSLVEFVSAVDYPLTGTSLDGSSIVIDPIKKQRPVLLVFWASWCGACMKEIPHVKKVHAAFSDKIDVVSCSIDTDLLQAQQCVQQHALPYPVIGDGNMKIADQFAVDATPTLIVIGSTGELLARGRSLRELRVILNSVGVTVP